MSLRGQDERRAAVRTTPKNGQAGISTNTRGANLSCGQRRTYDYTRAVVKEVEVRKRIFTGVAVGVTGLCLLGSPGIAQAKTTPTITPSFIAKVNTFCAAEATQITTAEGGSFPYPNFNPYAPDVKTMRLAGAFFAKALSVRQVVPQQLEAVGEPTSGQRQWNDLKAIDAESNRIAITQVHDAQAGNVKGFVSTVRQLTSVQNDLVKEAVKDGFTKSSPCTEAF